MLSIQFPFPILITKENKWFVASCPILDIATQGKTEKEVKENVADLISDYLNDPDTRKPSLEDLMSFSLTNIAVKVPEGVIHRKLRPLSQRKVIEILRSNGFEEARSSKHITFKKKVGERV